MRLSSPSLSIVVPPVAAIVDKLPAEAIHALIAAVALVAAHAVAVSSIELLNLVTLHVQGFES